MAEGNKYYFLKLKDNFFDSNEVRILESMPKGIYYSNMLIKLYLLALKNDGALKLNDYTSLDENMIAALTNLDIEIVRSGLEALASLDLIERLEDGTIYMSHMQSFVGSSVSEAERKRLYREKLEEEKQQLKQTNATAQVEMSDKNSVDNGTTTDKRPPENRDKEIRYIENRDKEIKDLEFRYLELRNLENREIETKDKKNIDSLSDHTFRDFENRTWFIDSLYSGALNKADEHHGTVKTQRLISIGEYQCIGYG